jgi:hypothetical protein
VLRYGKPNCWKPRPFRAPENFTWVETSSNLHLGPINLIALKPTIYVSAALFGPRSLFSVSWSITQSVGLIGRGISLSQTLYSHIVQHEHRINAHRQSRSHDPSVRTSEENSCLRPRGHCDRHQNHQPLNKLGRGHCRFWAAVELIYVFWIVE